MDGADDLWPIRRGDQPLLATAIHDGHEIRPELVDLLAISEADRLREEDPFTARWTTVAANRIVARRSRFEVDLNRPPEQAVYQVPDDAWGLQVWKERPSAEVVERSMAENLAFYDLLRRELDDLVARFGHFVVFDIHSYNHRRGGPDASPDDPELNPVVNEGTGTMDRGWWSPLVDRFEEELEGQVVGGDDLDVRENVTFEGGHLSTWVHENFPTQGCSLSIEFKKVYLDEWTGEPDEGVIVDLERALAATVPGVLASLDALADR
jgi:hypothetical protein